MLLFDKKNTVFRQILWYNVVIKFMYTGNWKCIHLFQTDVRAI